mgnify:CR=1 FL=1
MTIRCAGEPWSSIGVARRHHWPALKISRVDRAPSAARLGRATCATYAPIVTCAMRSVAVAAAPSSAGAAEGPWFFGAGGTDAATRRREWGTKLLALPALLQLGAGFAPSLLARSVDDCMAYVWIPQRV